MTSADEILRRIAAENQAARVRFAEFAHRTVLAVVNNDRDAFSGIIKDAGIDDEFGNDSGQSEASGSESLETGDVNEHDRDTQPTESQENV